MNNILKSLLAVAFVATLSSFANAQSPVITQPYLLASTNASSTISSTNVFQSVFAKPTGTQKRASCTIQNNGSNNMWVFFGAIASATKTTSVVLTVGQAGLPAPNRADHRGAP